MMNNYLDFQNGYKVLYEAKDKVTEEAPGPVYASQILQRVADKMCISYNKDTNEYVDLSQFKLIYSDGVNLIGSTSLIPTAADVKLVIKDVDGTVVLGEAKTAVTVTCDSDHVILEGAGNYLKDAEVTVSVAPAEGYVFKAGITPKVGEEDMTDDDGKFVYKLIVGDKATTVEIAGVVVE